MADRLTGQETIKAKLRAAVLLKFFHWSNANMQVFSPSTGKDIVTIQLKVMRTSKT